MYTHAQTSRQIRRLEYWRIRGTFLLLHIQGWVTQHTNTLWLSGRRQIRVQKGRQIKVCLTIACDFGLTTFFRGHRSKQGADRFFYAKKRRDRERETERERKRDGKKEYEGDCIDCWLSHLLVSRTPQWRLTLRWNGVMEFHSKWAYSFLLSLLFVWRVRPRFKAQCENREERKTNVVIAP